MGTVAIGANNYDIYGTRAEADAYFAARIGADAWTSASSGDKDKSLVSATRWLDRQNWREQKTVSSQALEFPRTNLLDKDGNALSDADVPEVVEIGSYELALAILRDSTIQDNINTGSNTKSVKAGSAAVEFFRPSTGSKLPDVALEYVSLFLEGADQSGVGSAAFGTDACSTFEDRDAWGRNKGFP